MLGVIDLKETVEMPEVVSACPALPATIIPPAVGTPAEPTITAAGPQVCSQK